MIEENLNEHTIKEKITVLEEIKNLIPPLKEDELRQLEANILTEGKVTDPITIWKTTDQLILVDGHNRLDICKRHNLPIPYVFKSFSNLDEVKIWVINHQIGRRNMTPMELSYFRGQCYLLKKDQAPQEDRWLAKLANQFAVVEKTIKRDAEYAEKLNSQPDLKNQILSGKLKASKSSILKQNGVNKNAQPQLKYHVEKEINNNNNNHHSDTKIAFIAFAYVINEHRPFGEVMDEVNKTLGNVNIDDEDYPLHFFTTWYKLHKPEED